MNMKHSVSLRGSPATALFVVTFAIFTDMLVYGLVVPILPRYALSLGASQAALGFLFGSYSIALLLATPIMGMLSDRVGRRGPLLAGLLGLAGATLLFAYATNFALLVLARILQGLSAAATWTAGLALLADISPPQERGKTMGIALSGMAMGTLIGPVFGGLLFQWGGYRLPFFVAAGMALLDGMARLLLLREPRERVHEPGASVRLLRERSIVVISIVVIIGAALPSFLEPTLPLHLQAHLGASPAVIGILFAVPTLAYGISTPLAGLLTDRLGRRPPMLLGLIGGALVIPLIALASSMLLAGGVLFLLGIMLGLLMTPTLPELSDIVDRTGSTTYGAAYALYNFVYSLGLMIGPITGGLLTNSVGLLRALLIVAAGMLLFALLLILAHTHSVKPLMRHIFAREAC
jgi:DHA1 family solute carrier family 18 vesicular amine transporter 1/2